MSKYIETDKLIAEIKRYKNKADERLKIKGRSYAEEEKDSALQNLCGNLLHFISSFQQEQQDELKTWLTKKFNLAKKCMISADRDWNRAYENGEMEAYANVLLHIGETPDRSQKEQEQPDNMIQWTGNNLKEVIGFTGKSRRFGEWFKSWEDYENYVHTHNDTLKLFCEDGSHYEVPVGAWIVKTPDGYNLPSVAKYIQNEQTNVDLEKEIDKWFFNYVDPDSGESIPKENCWLNNEQTHRMAHYFYQFGKNSK